MSDTLPENIRASHINLGLDLRGGAAILLEVDVASYRHEQLQQQIESIRSKIHQLKIRNTTVSNDNGEIIINFQESENITLILNILREILGYQFSHSENNGVMRVTIDQSVYKDSEKDLVKQSIEIIRRRVDETGTKEIDIQRQGGNQILLQVPGADNPEEIKRLIGKTAKLSFHLVESDVSIQTIHKDPRRAKLKVIPLESSVHSIVIYSRPLITGEMLVNAQVSFHLNNPVVNFKLNNAGAKIFGDVSSKNTGKRFAIVLDDKAISAPVINEPILGGSGMISGNFSVDSANELALLLRAGALPAPLKIIEERTIGPSLGRDSIEAGIKAVVIGTCLVIVVMILFYGIFGLAANIALIMNIIMIIGWLSLFGATLTLPGIAGIVLTLGMAVDANVLICERIREELARGKSNLAAMESGYKIALTTIVDSNITTIIAALILYIFGTGPIKGFAVSLTVGILCSMFTAISLTKLLTSIWYFTFKPKKLYL